MTKKPERKRKRVVVIGDLHCGGEFSIAPPDWQYKPITNPTSSTIYRQNKCAEFQKTLWDWYVKEIEALKPVDILVGMGDMIDGPGIKTGGAEQIHTDVIRQCEMAAEAIKIVGAQKILLVYGSKYHCSDAGGATDYEDIVAKDCGAMKIGAHEWLDVNGTIFDIKHKVSRSSVPHTRGTAIAREYLWSALWSEMQLAPRSNIILRAHAHTPFAVEDPTIPYLAMITPALQWSTRFGTRECTGTVGVGITHFDVEANGEYQYFFHIAKLPTQRTYAVKW
jgi:hypothetical protein